MNIRLQRRQRKVITCSKDVYRLMLPILLRKQKIDRNREHCWVIGLARNNVVLYVEQISMGSVCGTVVHPMEVFCLALRRRCSSIVLVHNHPSQDHLPSSADKAITAKLVEAGELLQVKLRDHLVITERSYYRFWG